MEGWTIIWNWRVQDNDIGMYSAFNKGKSIFVERFIRTLFTNRIAVSKNVYFDVLDDIVNKYNKAYNKTSKRRSLMLNLIFILNIILILTKQILNFRLVIM